MAPPLGMASDAGPETSPWIEYGSHASAMIVSIHRYDLADATTDEAFLAAVSEAENRGLFDLPGLVEHRFLRGIKGTRTGQYAAVWRYESRQAWEAIWGPVEDPIPPVEYPDTWRAWEDELLAPLLAGEPDEVEFTTYEVVAGGGAAPELA